MARKVFLVNNHDEVLKFWKRNKKGSPFSLVHVDAHPDFNFYAARPIKDIFQEAGSPAEMKELLERHIAYRYYTDNFDGQQNVGNYIYPAMRENIVGDFYWVIPGGMKEFKASLPSIRAMFRSTFKDKFIFLPRKSGGLIKVGLQGRNFYVCTLEKLPLIREKSLLDIDTDFLVVHSYMESKNIEKIGERTPWIMPQKLVTTLKKKVVNPHLLTIAYSLNRGYTPTRYKYLGDEIAYLFSPRHFRRHFEKCLKAARHFELFLQSGEKRHYWQAAGIDPVYRAKDNNYGPLYLALGKLVSAKKEFLRILKADPQNAASLLGLGLIASKKRNFKKAKALFSRVLNAKSRCLFKEAKKQALLEMGKVEFGLKNYKKAKFLLLRSRRFFPMHPDSYYFLAMIFEKERNFNQAVKLYQDALRWGASKTEIGLRLSKIPFAASK